MYIVTLGRPCTLVGVTAHSNRTCAHTHNSLLHTHTYSHTHTLTLTLTLTHTLTHAHMCPKVNLADVIILEYCVVSSIGSVVCCTVVDGAASRECQTCSSTRTSSELRAGQVYQS